MIETFKCSKCRKVYPSGSYKITTNGNIICYPCAKHDDMNQMKQRGAITLYLDYDRLHLTNFAGEVMYRVDKMNVTRTQNNQTLRVVWFYEGTELWKGEQYGYNKACYCTRLPRVKPDLSLLQGLLHRLETPVHHKTRRVTPSLNPFTLLRFYK